MQASRKDQDCGEVVELDDLHRIIQHAREGIVVTQQGRIAYCNPWFGEVVGYALPELLGAPIEHLLHPDDRETVLRRHQARLDGQSPRARYDLRLLKKDGEPVLVEAAISLTSWQGEVATLSLLRDMSSHRRMEETLLASEERYRELFENIPVGIFQTDSAGRALHVNPEMARILGVDSPEDAVRRYRDLARDLYKSPRRRVEFVKELREKGVVENFEYEARSLDGTPLWLNMNAKIQRRFADGSFVISGFTADITARKLAERSQAAMAALGENSTDIIIIKDLEGRFLATNRTFADALGLSSVDEAIGKTDSELLGIPEDQEPVRSYREDDRLALSLPPGRIVDREETIPFADGIDRVFHTRKYAIRDAGGTPFAIGLISSDITARRKAEEELALSERKFRELFNHAGEGIFLADGESVITDANIAAAKLLGYDAPGELIGMSADDILHPEDTERMPRQTTFARSERGQVVRLERRYLKKDGTYLPVVVSIKFFTDGDLHHVMFSDISERKRLEEALRSRIVALTRPLDDPGGVTLESLFDMDDLQRMQDEFSEAMDVASLITTPEGEPITRPSNFRRLCEEVIRSTDKGRKNCLRSDAKLGEGLSGAPKVQKCLSGGLWDAGAPITVGGRRIANWLVGQVRNEAQDEEAMRRYAREIGADEDVFMKAYDEVPVMPLERFKVVARAMHTLARHLSTMAYQNMQQARFISERATAEEKNRLLADIIDASDSIAVFKDPELRYRMVNRAYLKLTGYTDVAQVLLKTDRELFSGKATEEQIDEYMENDRAALRLPPGQSWTAEERMADEKNPGGPGRYFLTRKFPIHAEDKTLLGVATMTSEITSQKRLEHALREAKEKAEAANSAKSAFLANMSHEMRTPLNGIMGMLQLIQTTPLDNEQANYAATGLQSCNRLTRLLGGILDLARIEAGKMELREETFDLKELVDSVEKLFAPAAEQAGLDLVFLLEPEAPARLVGDHLRLYQVLNNLVGNAVKFTARGEVRLEVSALPTLTEGRCRLLFTISDTGIGIPDDKLESMFESFTQAESSLAREYQGAGLGLAITRRLLQLMGGAMDVISIPGKGTTFFVSLPFALQGEGARTATGGGMQPQAGTGEPWVLVAEDDAVSRLAATRMLEKHGCRVLQAQDGDQALERLRGHPCDLVLMDARMPILDGLEATRAIRRGEAGAEHGSVPIYGLTGLSSRTELQELLESGMDGRLTKPLEMDALRELLERLGLYTEPASS
jgi:PAS domain S-box-containing protein